MCTAITFKTKDFYFGRTLDHDLSYGEEVTVVPRNFPLSFRFQDTLEHHYAMVGMAHVVEGYPLLFDGRGNPKPAFWAVADPESVK